MNAPRIIDLTQVLRPGLRGVEIESARTLAHDGWNATTLHLYSHSGTHMDAQKHFEAGPETIDQHLPERCLGPAWVIRVDNVVPQQLIEVDDLRDIADKLRPGESLLLQTGWSRHVNEPAIYRDGLPRISEKLARWCVDRRVKLLGVEAPSVADVNNLDEVTRIHRILLAGGVTIVEGLMNLEQITQSKVLFIALPLKIADGDGCPCRALAIESNSPDSAVVFALGASGQEVPA